MHLWSDVLGVHLFQRKRLVNKPFSKQIVFIGVEMLVKASGLVFIYGAFGEVCFIKRQLIRPLERRLLIFRLPRVNPRNQLHPDSCVVVKSVDEAEVLLVQSVFYSNPLPLLRPLKQLVLVIVNLGHFVERHQVYFEVAEGQALNRFSDALDFIRLHETEIFNIFDVSG